MTHRAESILDAVETALTGLTTTGSNVTRGRVWPIDTLPALTIAKGVDQAHDDDESLETLIREMTVSVVCSIQQSGNPETNLNAIAAEVYAALRADPTLGLAYVYDTSLIGDDEIETDDTQDIRVARMVSTWRVVYDHSKADAET